MGGRRDRDELAPRIDGARRQSAKIPGKRVSKWRLTVRVEPDLSRDCFSRYISRATTSRGASSARRCRLTMKRLPAASRNPLLHRARLRDERERVFRRIQGSGMKLYELHVAQHGTSAVRDRIAVAGRNERISRVR